MGRRAVAAVGAAAERSGPRGVCRVERVLHLHRVLVERAVHLLQLILERLEELTVHLLLVGIGLLQRLEDVLEAAVVDVLVLPAGVLVLLQVLAELNGA